MIDDDRLALTRYLELQLADYWYEVDCNWGREAHFYYTEDAVFEGSSGVIYEGRDRIAEFYAYREERGARTAVHAVTNFRAWATGPNQAEASWYLHLYAADGLPPHEVEPPILVALMSDCYTRQTDGGWLCTRRKFTPLFRGGVPVTALPDAPRVAGSTA